MNLLFTSVGRRVELMNYFRDAMKQSGKTGKIVGTDIDFLAPTREVVDEFVIVPKYTDPKFIDSLIEVCKEHEISAIFPLIDPDILLIAEAKVRFEQLGCKVFVADVPNSKICDDKNLTGDFFNELGMATPKTWSPESIPNDMSFPAFIKPYNGSAAKHTYKIETPHELDFFKDYVPNAVVQQFIDGVEITTDVLCDLEGKAITVVSRQRIAVRDGEVVKGVTVFYPELDSMCRKIANHLKAPGPITIQCLYDGSEFYFIEINARLGGGIPLGIAAGVDTPGMLLDLISGQEVPSQTPGDYQQELYITRFDESFFVVKD